MFKYLSHHYTEWLIEKNNLDYESQYDKIEQNARNVFHAIITTLVILIIAWVMGILLESILVVFIINWVRHIISGIHSSSLWRCFFYSVPLVIVTSYISSIASETLNLNLFIIFSFLSFGLLKFLPFGKKEYTFEQVRIVQSKYINVCLLFMAIGYVCSVNGFINISNVIAMSFCLIVLTSKNWLHKE